MLVAFMPYCFGQGLSHKVLVPMASVVDVGYYNVNQTVGESMVKAISSDEYHLTQGFHQPSIYITGPARPDGSGVEVYPNPVVDLLKVELFGVERTEFEIIIFGLNGSLFYQRKISCGRDYWQKESIDVSHYKRGMYFVRIRSKDSRITRLFKIEKM
ncbi:MAG: T9SS type A sorting domain-containing protein [Bacteroidales bacterium]|nr:T9SS type A sorting domain-containing protein [Bacteroidales bacterium]